MDKVWQREIYYIYFISWDCVATRSADSNWTNLYAPNGWDTALATLGKAKIFLDAWMLVSGITLVFAKISNVTVPAART